MTFAKLADAFRIAVEARKRLPSDHPLFAVAQSLSKDEMLQLARILSKIYRVNHSRNDIQTALYAVLEIYDSMELEKKK